MSEIPNMRRIWLGVAVAAMTLFRCNTGKAWASGAGKVVHMRDGSVVVPAARPIALGLSFPNGDPVVGTHDLLGWTEVVITPQMVGHTIPVFSSIDAKNDDGGRQRKEQVTWMNNVQRAGGIAGFASTVEQALEIVATWHKKFDK